MADWADNLVEVLDGLQIERADVLGGHNGASVAAEMALRHPARVGSIVLDGCPLLTPELRAAFAALAATTTPSPEQAPTFAWDRAVGLLSEYIPGFSVDEHTIGQVWPAMIDYLQTGFVSSAPVAGRYDLAARLPEVTHRSLLLGARRDPLAGSFAQALALLRPAAHHVFEGNHPIHFADRTAEYARVVSAFLAAAPQGSEA
jgi:pimeloyl-ACP methyl ester carboxylesterase